MANGLRGWMLLLITLVSLGGMRAHAQGAESPEPRAELPQVLPHAAHGLFTGDEFRYRHDKVLSGFLMRLGADLLSIPTGLPWWTPSEWGFFGVTVGSTVLLSAGTPSVDVRFQDFVTYQLLGPDHFRIWGTAGDLIIWSGVGVAMLAVLIYGLIAKDQPTIETAMLMFEACAISQIYHQMIKLLTGRAGPQRPELYGHYFGPAKDGIWLYPEGTPSGHVASIYSMLSVLMHMVDHPALWVGGNLAALIVSASIVGDNYHWLSECTFGAAIGFVVGRWIVRHRSTHYVYGVDPRPKTAVVDINLLPIIVPGSGAGFGIVGTF